MNRELEPRGTSAAGRAWSIADRRDLELKYLRRVQLAGALWKDLTIQCRLHRELTRAALGPDRELLHECGLRLYDALQHALDQYRCELQRFNSMVVDRELPEDFAM